VELYEQIRREYEHGVGTIRAVAKKLGVHRRMVREALADALPPERKKASNTVSLEHGRTAGAATARLRGQLPKMPISPSNVPNVEIAYDAGQNCCQSRRRTPPATMRG
jgi:hypothetical protein